MVNIGLGSGLLTDGTKPLPEWVFKLKLKLKDTLLSNTGTSYSGQIAQGIT